MLYPVLRDESGNRVTMDLCHIPYYEFKVETASPWTYAIYLITSSKWKPRHHEPMPYPLLRVQSGKRVTMDLCHIPYYEFKVETASPWTHAISLITSSKLKQCHHGPLPYPLLRVQSGNRVTMDPCHIPYYEFKVETALPWTLAISLITTSKWKPRHHGPMPYPLLRVQSGNRVTMDPCHIPYYEFKVETASQWTHAISLITSSK